MDFNANLLVFPVTLRKLALNLNGEFYYGIEIYKD